MRCVRGRPRDPADGRPTARAPARRGRSPESVPVSVARDFGTRDVWGPRVTDACVRETQRVICRLRLRPEPRRSAEIAAKDHPRVKLRLPTLFGGEHLPPECLSPPGFSLVSGAGPRFPPHLPGRRPRGPVLASCRVPGKAEVPQKDGGTAALLAGCCPTPGGPGLARALQHLHR